MRRGFNLASLGARPFEPSSVLIEFAKALRIARNTTNVYAKHQRYTLSFSEFFTRHRQFLLALHNNARHMWKQQGDRFPDWGDVTTFSVVVKSAVPQLDVLGDRGVRRLSCRKMAN